MKKVHWTKVLDTCKTFIILGLIGGLVYQVFYAPVKTHNNVVDLISLSKAPSDTLRDDRGQLHAKKNIVYIETWGMAEALYKEEIDSLREELKLSKKDNIGSLGVINTTTETTFKPKLVHDTVNKIINLSYKTKWVDLSVTTDSSKKSKLIYKDSLTFATVHKKSGFLNLKETTFVDVKSANPDVKHIGVNYFEVKQGKNNRSKWGLGFGVGPGVSFSSNGVLNYSWITVNAGVQYRF